MLTQKCQFRRVKERQSNMTPISKTVYEIHVKVPIGFKEVLFHACSMNGDKTVSRFVRNTLIAKCRDILNGNALMDTVLEDLDTLDQIEQKETK
jgi:hypothetical protein